MPREGMSFTGQSDDGMGRCSPKPSWVPLRVWSSSHPCPVWEGWNGFAEVARIGREQGWTFCAVQFCCPRGEWSHLNVKAQI